MVLICGSGAERLHFTGAIPPVPLLARIRDTIQVKHYNTRTARARCDWIKRFVIFDSKRHPSGLARAEVATVLPHVDQMFDRPLVFDEHRPMTAMERNALRPKLVE